jgi:hypothetical protein
MFARSTCGMIMYVSGTCVFYIFFPKLGFLIDYLFTFITVIPESFERKNTPVDDG